MSPYDHILATHSILRWFVLPLLLLVLFASAKGRKQPQSRRPNKALRLVTTIVLHLQLVLGLALLHFSPLVKQAFKGHELHFGGGGLYALLHTALMLTAVIFFTIKGAKARRAQSTQAAHQQLYVGALVALILILVAIPWPGSPILEGGRPLMRGF